TRPVRLHRHERVQYQLRRIPDGEWRQVLRPPDDGVAEHLLLLTERGRISQPDPESLPAARESSRPSREWYGQRTSLTPKQASMTEKAKSSIRSADKQAQTSNFHALDCTERASIMAARRTYAIGRRTGEIANEANNKTWPGTVMR